MRTVLIGDSHLARLNSHVLSIDVVPVVNVAAGGASVEVVLDQAASLPLGAGDIVVVSVGTNDAAPWKQTSLAGFRSALHHLTHAFEVRAWVYVTPPGVDESRLGGSNDRTNEAVGIYRDEATTIFLTVGSTIVRAHEVLADLGSEAFLDDGVHLTAAAYSVLLPEIEDAVSK